MEPLIALVMVQSLEHKAVILPKIFPVQRQAHCQPLPPHLMVPPLQLPSKEKDLSMNSQKMSLIN